VTDLGFVLFEERSHKVEKDQEASERNDEAFSCFTVSSAEQLRHVRERLEVDNFH
jgi:hypothetical protein